MVYKHCSVPNRADTTPRSVWGERIFDDWKTQLKKPAMGFEHKGNTGNHSLEAGFHGMDAIRVQLETSFSVLKPV